MLSRLSFAVAGALLLTASALGQPPANPLADLAGVVPAAADAPAFAGATTGLTPPSPT